MPCPSRGFRCCRAVRLRAPAWPIAKATESPTLAPEMYELPMWVTTAVVSPAGVPSDVGVEPWEPLDACGARQRRRLAYALEDQVGRLGSSGRPAGPVGDHHDDPNAARYHRGAVLARATARLDHDDVLEAGRCTHSPSALPKSCHRAVERWCADETHGATAIRRPARRGSAKLAIVGEHVVVRL